MSRYDPQSEFASAHVRAVAAAAGFFIQEATRTFDADGLDLEMMSRGPLGVTRSPRLHLQVKSVGGDVVEVGWATEYDRYKGVDEMMPFAHAVSAKSYAFDADGNESTIDFERMLTIVRRAGYRGWIGVEYEGDAHSEDEGIRLTRDLLVRLRDQLAASE